MACFPTNFQSRWLFREDTARADEAKRANNVLMTLFEHGFEPRESMSLNDVLLLGHNLQLFADEDD